MPLLDAVFSTASHIAVLRVLSKTKHGLSGRALAREAGFQHGAIRQTIQRLESLGLLERLGSGKTQLIRLKFDSQIASGIILPMLAAERSLMNGVRAAIRDSLLGTAVSVTIFGSFAKNQNGRDSDLDLLVVANDGGKAAALEKLSELGIQLRKEYGIRLSPIVKTKREIRPVNDRGDLMKNIEREGVDLLETAFKDLR